jgi:hypothetical protein
VGAVGGIEDWDDLVGVLGFEGGDEGSLGLYNWKQLGVMRVLY